MLKSPAAARAKCLVELGAVGLLGRCVDPIVEKLGILADDNAPFLRLHAIEDDCCRLCRARRRALAETSFQLLYPRPDLIVGIAGDVDTLRGEPFARGRNVDRVSPPLRILREFVGMSVPI
jgi:hypothetical protein